MFRPPLVLTSGGLLRTVNDRAVDILLECLLVEVIISSASLSYGFAWRVVYTEDDKSHLKTSIK